MLFNDEIMNLVCFNVELEMIKGERLLAVGGGGGGGGGCCQILCLGLYVDLTLTRRLSEPNSYFSLKMKKNIVTGF